MRSRMLARRHRLALIEDACEAIGARFDGRRAGSFGDLAVLGFYPNKQMTTGEGGAVLARDPAHAARLRRLSNQGRDASADWLDSRSSRATTTGSRSWPARWAACSCAASMRCSRCAGRPRSATMRCSRGIPALSVRRSRFRAARSVGLSTWCACLKAPTATGCRPRLPGRASPPAATLRPSTCSRPWRASQRRRHGHLALTESDSRGAHWRCRSSTASRPSQQQEVADALRAAIHERRVMRPKP